MHSPEMRRNHYSYLQDFIVINPSPLMCVRSREIVLIQRFITFYLLFLKNKIVLHSRMSKQLNKQIEELNMYLSMTPNHLT